MFRVVGEGVDVVVDAVVISSSNRPLVWTVTIEGGAAAGSGGVVIQEGTHSNWTEANLSNQNKPTKK